MTTAPELEPTPGRAHLAGRLAILRSRVLSLVEARRIEDPKIEDPFRGLYIDESQLERLHDRTDPAPPDPFLVARLSGVERVAEEATAAGGERAALHRLADASALDALDVELLLVCVAPDLDGRYEWLYALLNDDVTRRRPTIGLAMELCGRSEFDCEARSRFVSGAPLIDSALLTVEEPRRPFLSRTLRAPDRLAAYLLGSTAADAALSPLVSGISGHRVEGSAALARVLDGSFGVAYVRDRPGTSGAAMAAATANLAGGHAVVLDLGRASADADWSEILDAVVREAVLGDALIVVGPIDGLLRSRPEVITRFAEAPTRIVLYGQEAWDASWSTRVPLVFEAPPIPADLLGTVWREHLEGAAGPGVDVRAASAGFRLTSNQVANAAAAARVMAALEDSSVFAEHIRAGARQQNAGGLARLASRVEPAVGWDDLVVDAETENALRELSDRARFREQVLAGWDMRPGGARGRGVAGLFVGDSGTGKTMSAEVIAGDLGLDLYVINLATVVDKYIGETEKNLERVFSEADGVNGILLFDEADALFGKRSDVSDARDRYANLEVAYLLQRMETFDGVAILSTNLRANLDDAFIRRLDSIVNFETPDAAARLALWEKCLGARLPRRDDVDLRFCADSFELTGGSIRAVSITAAYRAAAAGQPVAMTDLVLAVAEEYRKQGRLCRESDFGAYVDVVNEARRDR